MLVDREKKKIVSNLGGSRFLELHGVIRLRTIFEFAVYFFISIKECWVFIP